MHKSLVTLAMLAASSTLIAQCTVNCASKVTYGTGCNAVPADIVHELFPIGSWDITNSVTFIRGTNDYLMLDTIPGVYVPPTANAVVVTSGDDTFTTMALSAAMPTVRGTTLDLTICSNGYISMSPNPPHAGIGDYSPTVLELEAFTEPTICGPWYDWSPNQGGQLVFEEAGGIAYVTWDQVPAYNAFPVVDTLQFQFDLSTGSCTVVYVTMAMGGTFGWHSAILGATTGSSNFVSTGYDMSVDLAATILISDGALPLSLDGNAPVLGGNWTITTSNIDPLSPISITFFGARGPALPTSAIGFDAPGCELNLLSAVADITAATTANLDSSFSFPIPNMTNLVGYQVSCQSICLTLTNNANILFSNGLEGTVGY